MLFALRNSMPALLAFAFALLYIRTAAPSVLSGDSAEFQLAAIELGVPHPTGYPLYTMLAHLLTLIPGDAARRVTQFSALCAALTVGLSCALLFRLLERSSASAQPLRTVLASGCAMLTLGCSPNLWNTATLAEVYALNMLLLAGLGLALLQSARPLLLGVLLGIGLGHHSSFAPLALPPLLAFMLHDTRRPAELLRRAALLGSGMLFGLLPLLFPLLVFWRFGPFDGTLHGLPIHYFWGAPGNLQDLLAHLSGGPLRRDALVLPDAAQFMQLLQMLNQRIIFEIGALGALLALIGLPAMLIQQRAAALLSLWVAATTLLSVMLLGPAVQDAPIFLMPLLLPISLWIGFGVWSLIGIAQHELRLRSAGLLLGGGLLALILIWGGTRLRYTNKAELWLYRSFAERVLQTSSRDAVVITRWEQGTTLLYLQVVEAQRRDLQIIVSEPEDQAWASIMAQHPQRTIYIIGTPDDAAALGAEAVFESTYAGLYRQP